MPLPAKIGKYEIIDVIGRGGMGVVYKARDTVLGRLVALKVMTSGLADNAEVRERFLREARSVSMLQHASIVVVFELGEHDGSPYIVMEYLDGQPLDRTIRDHTVLSVVQKIDIVLQVAKALQYAHEKGIIHRDIKPGNIMLLRDGTVKVVDFGIAHLADQTITKSGIVLGTIAYMSPEQLNGCPVDARTDIYSLGIVFYLLLTGKLPFEGGSTAETMMKILLEPPPQLEQGGDIDPPELQPIIDKALAKAAKDRYQVCSDFSVNLAQSRKRLELATQLEKLNQERHVILAELNLPNQVRPSTMPRSPGATATALAVAVSDRPADPQQTRQTKPVGHPGRRNRLPLIITALAVAALLIAALLTYRMHSQKDTQAQMPKPGLLGSPPPQTTKVDHEAGSTEGIPAPRGVNPTITAAREAPQPTRPVSSAGDSAHQNEKSKPEPTPARTERHPQSSIASAPEDSDKPRQPVINSATPEKASLPDSSAPPVVQQQLSLVPPPLQVQEPVTPEAQSVREVIQNVRIPPHTWFTVRPNSPLDSKHSHAGDVWRGRLAAPIQVGNQTAVPSGAEVTGRVADPRKSVSGVKHDSGLVLELTSMSVNGKSYKIQTNQWANLSLKRHEVKLDPELLLNFELLDALTISH